MTIDHIPSLLLGFGLGVWAGLGAVKWALNRKLKTQAAELESLKAQTPSDTPSPAAQQLADKLNSLPAPVASADCPWVWYSLPGQRLELGDTGFYITFHPTVPRRVYQCYTPEHIPITAGPLLDEMKKYIEDRAKERAQFAPGGWPK